MKRESPSYRYTKPFPFLGKGYYDSCSLLDALIDHWDMGIAAAKAGCFENFYTQYVKQECDSTLHNYSEMDEEMNSCTERLWSNEYGYDAVFARLLHFIEPRLRELPYPYAEDDIIDSSYKKQYTRKVTRYGPDELKFVFRYSEGIGKKLKGYLASKYQPEKEWLMRYRNARYASDIESDIYFFELFENDCMRLYGYSELADLYAERGLYQCKDDGNYSEDESLQNYCEKLENFFVTAATYIAPVKIFEYQKKGCRFFSKFVNLFINEIKDWKIAEWDRFVEELTAEKPKQAAFDDWLEYHKKKEFAIEFRNWKKAWELDEQVQQENADVSDSKTKFIEYEKQLKELERKEEQYRQLAELFKRQRVREFPDWADMYVAKQFAEEKAELEKRYKEEKT